MRRCPLSQRRSLARSTIRVPSGREPVRTRLSVDTHMPHAKTAASTPGVVALTATVGRERMIPPPHIRRSEPDCLQERADAAVAAFVVDLSAGGS